MTRPPAPGGEGLEEALARQETAWRARPLLRQVYADWDELIVSRLSSVPGPTVELGAGIGHFEQAFPAAVATDVEPTSWAEAVVDAEAMPYADGTVSNLVLIDVFHHLARPALFLDEARRVLAPGGRIVVLDPYCSPVSTVAYRRYHHERTDLSAPALDADERVAAAPLESNQARATLAFFRGGAEIERRWPELRFLERRRLSMLLYPLSGGFSRPQLVPTALYRPLAALERALAPLAPLAAFRCLVVLERA